MPQSRDQVNPLDHPGEIFDLDLLNPNPSSSKTKEGPKYRVSFEVDRETWDWFMGARTEGMMIAAKATVYESDEHESLEKPAAAKKPWGHVARYLHLGWLLNEHVLQEAGSDQQFQDWLKEQPCAARSRNQVCEGDIVPAHVRRVGLGSGTSLKPAYAAIPLCAITHHGAQHQAGESAVIDNGREWFEKKRVQYVEAWASQAIAGQLGYPSLGYVPPEKLIHWAECRELPLPTEYIEAAMATGGST